MKTIPLFITAIFSTLLIIVFYFLIRIFRRGTPHISTAQRNLPLIVVSVILALEGILAYNGWLLKLDAMPPCLLLAVLPMVLCAIYFALIYKPFSQELQQVPKASVIYLQSFRLILELLFLWFVKENILPIQMTLEGRNPDLLIGLTAPLVAYFGIQKKKLPRWAIITWNFIGLAFLFNIVIIAILSTPTPLRYFMNEPANTLVMRFPYHYIATFLVPLALFLHLFSLKQFLYKQSA